MKDPNRKMPPWKRNGVTWSLTLGAHKLHLRTGEYEDGTLAEVFVDWHKQGAFTRHAIHTVAQLTSLCLQHGIPLAKLVKAFKGQEFEPSGQVTGHETIKSATSIVDLVFRVLGEEYLGREKGKV